MSPSTSAIWVRADLLCSARVFRVLTLMYGPAVRCKRFSSIWQMRSCINVSGLWLERVVLRAIMDISAHATLLADRLQRAVRVTSVRMRREDRSPSSSHPLADLGRLRAVG